MSFDSTSYLMGRGSAGGGGGGGGSGVLVVNISVSGTISTMNKTFAQIFDGMTSNGVVAVEESAISTGIRPVLSVYKEIGVYEVLLYGDVIYSAESEDGYPQRDDGLTPL